MGSGPYAEGWAHENPDDPADRAATTVQLPHVVVSDELLAKANQARLDAERRGCVPPEATHAAVNAVAGELWQAGFDAGQKVARGVVNCPQCARNDTVSRAHTGQLRCAWCGWSS